ncbi:MAG: ATP-binding cassette domain-containing protein [Bdellovibrionaceae bacterium]|nr:ATP-binding cassette domain-containing protein [Pseudobdellovibrionaceae bacterium]MDW8190556.1 ATP-binding cassette domain-containing protein [Pseudobdellovibrionaceae bacterium]
MTLIKVLHFAKSYGNKVVHRDINFSLQKNEILGLLGGSGSGKSVLLRSLIGLEKPSHGSIFLFNENTQDFSEEQWISIRKKISYAFQGGALFDSMTVFENLAFPLQEHSSLSEQEINQRVVQILKEFNLDEALHKYPNQLSGGMQKRVGLARAIMLDPEVLLFDEPTAGLDPLNTETVKKMILQLKLKGVSGILVTHDMPVAFDICDRIALIDGGKIVTVSTPQEIIQTKDHPILNFSKGLPIFTKE